MNRKSLEIISGLALFIVLSLLFGWSIILRLPGVPIQLIEWLSSSLDPQLALFYFSTLVSATLLILVGFGVEIPKLKAYFTSEKVKRYLTGLPLWVLLLMWAGALVGFWYVFPSCQPPASIQFEVAGREKLYQPSETLIVAPGEGITVTARSTRTNATLSCSWEYAGTVFDTPDARQGCVISARISSQPGNGFLTVVVSENFCSQTSIFSLQTVIQSP